MSVRTQFGTQLFEELLGDEGPLHHPSHTVNAKFRAQVGLLLEHISQVASDDPMFSQVCLLKEWACEVLKTIGEATTIERLEGDIVVPSGGDKADGQLGQKRANRKKKKAN